MTEPQDTVEAINQAAVALWRRHFGETTDRPLIPLIYPELRTESLLIIGCNPAMPKRGHYNPPLFTDAIAADFPFADIQAKEAAVKATYPYFTACDRFAAHVGMPWEHVDLFFYRETNQNTFKSRVGNGKGDINAFGREQLALSLRLIAIARPRAIVVANAFASDTLHRHLGLGKFDRDGLYWFPAARERVPLFLSSMLSGQRSLDRFSHDRLVWHIRRTIETMP